MAHIYFGIPPQSNTSAPVETGVYLRMGTYNDDTTNPVNEFAHMPKGFTDASNNDASASEGIFITSVGSYIVMAHEESYIEVEETATLNLTGANYEAPTFDTGPYGDTVETSSGFGSKDDVSMTTTVNGSIEMEIEDGSFSLTGNSGFNVHSTGGDIGIKAPMGKYQVTGRNFITETKDQYIKHVAKTKRQMTVGMDTTVSLAIQLNVYATLSLAVKAFALSTKLASVATVGFQLNLYVVNTEYISTLAEAYVFMDIKVATLYVKYFVAAVKNTPVKATNDNIYGYLGAASVINGVLTSDSVSCSLVWGLIFKSPPATV